MDVKGVVDGETLTMEELEKGGFTLWAQTKEGDHIELKFDSHGYEALIACTLPMAIPPNPNQNSTVSTLLKNEEPTPAKITSSSETLPLQTSTKD